MNKIRMRRHMSTGWRSCTGWLKLQVSFRKWATNYRALLRKMTYKYKASLPPCTRWTRAYYTHKCDQEPEPHCTPKEPYYTHKEPHHTRKEPYPTHKETDPTHKEPHYPHKEPYYTHKEPHYTHKEPYYTHK